MSFIIGILLTSINTVFASEVDYPYRMAPGKNNTLKVWRISNDRYREKPKPIENIKKRDAKVVKKRKIKKESNLNLSLVPFIGSDVLNIQDKLNNTTANVSSKFSYGSLFNLSIIKKKKTIYIETIFKKRSYSQSSSASIFNKEQENFSLHAGVLFGDRFKYGLQFGQMQNSYLVIRDQNFAIENLSQTHADLKLEYKFLRAIKWHTNFSLFGGYIFSGSNDFVKSKSGQIYGASLNFDRLTPSGNWILGVAYQLRKQNTDKTIQSDLSYSLNLGYRYFY